MGRPAEISLLLYSQKKQSWNKMRVSGWLNLCLSVCLSVSLSLSLSVTCFLKKLHQQHKFLGRERVNANPIFTDWPRSDISNARFMRRRRKNQAVRFVFTDEAVQLTTGSVQLVADDGY